MSGMRIRTARKRTCTAMEMKTVHGLLVFLVVGLDTTISSNMVDDYLLPEVPRRDLPPWLPGVYCRLRFRCWQVRLVRANCARRRQAELQYQNWSTFLPQSPPPGQRRRPVTPGRPSGTGRAR